MNLSATIAQRLTFGFGLFFLLVAISGILGLSRLESVNDMLERIVAKDWKKVVLANEAIDLMNANARHTFLLFHASDALPVRQRIEANVKEISQKLDQLEALLVLPEGKAALHAVREQRKTYVAAFQTVGNLLDAGSRQEASQRLTSEVVPALDGLLGAMEKLIQVQGTILDRSAAEARATYATARYILIGFIAFAAVLGMVLGARIVRSVVVPLGGEPEDASKVFGLIAQGDLSVSVPVRAGDTSSLMAMTEKMRGGLHGMVLDLKAHAQEVAAASEQLAAAAEQIARRSEHQSDAASGMAAAVEEMTASITHVSDSAGESRQVTAETGELSRQGDSIIKETVVEMEAISATVGTAAETIEAVGESSEKISTIVQVIREVAEQTNLLALNAAIEAARAGEQGRGFAVVADEVRKLAERTSQATTEISAMIGAVQNNAKDAVATMQDAVTRVAQGVQKAQQAGASMSGISSGAQRVVSSVNDISYALKEQSIASNEIATNVDKIAMMSEENSTATHQAAATAARLRMLAAKMHDAVSHFRV